ncbi:MAG: DNA repair protein RadC [Burkholderiaceae bacterium]|nr:DNA repair protein RadC [Burkholderiaceae bacterium]
MSPLLLPPDARPREKLLAQGPAALADVELIALLLRTGLPGLGVLQLAQSLLDRFGGLPGLLRVDLADLAGVKGLGPAKRAEITAVLELARRSLRADLRQQTVFDAPEAVGQYLQLHLAPLGYEVFATLFLDTHHRLIAMEELFRGSLTQTSVYPREIVKRALMLGAAAVILAHNHPSGVAEPSRADELLTQALKTALDLVDVRVLDHIIVGCGACVSLAERGLL